VVIHVDQHLDSDLKVNAHSLNLNAVDLLRQRYQMLLDYE
jgi:hypothetical protein